MEIDIFDRDNSELYYDNKYVLDIMDEFFDTLPLRYRRNYDINLDTVILVKDNYGKYFPDDNLIVFDRPLVLIHELMHMASYDRYLDVDGYSDSYDNGVGITEGITEFLTMQAILKKIPSTYFLQVFAVEMLVYLLPVMEYYFIPDCDKFKSMFDNMELIDNLIYLLDYYTYHEVLDKPDEGVTLLLVKKIIDDLMMIGMELKNKSYEFELYKNYFIRKYQEYSKRYKIFMMDEIKEYILELMKKYKYSGKRRLKKKY